MVTRISRWWPVLYISIFLCAPRITFAADWVSIGFDNSNVRTALVDPQNNQHIVVSLAAQLNGNYNYFTDNGGTTWQPVSLGTAMTPCNNFAINPKSTNEVWAGCSVGMFRSIDGGKNFTPVNGYRNTQEISVNISEDGTIYMSSVGNNLHKSTDGLIWEILVAPGGSSKPAVFLNKENANEIYVSVVNSGLYKSNDKGNTWVLVNSQAQIRSGIGQMTFDKSGKICASVNTVGIGCSTDGGFTWSAFASPNITKPVEYQHFYRLYQNPDDDANLLVLAGTWGGLDTKIYIYKSGIAAPEVMPITNYISSINISQGKVFAFAASSGWIKGVWRNDGIVVVPEYLKKHPVIIVPGILGSWPVKGVWTIDPILNTYTDLIKAFKDNGYTAGKDLFVLPYNWHLDNNYTSTLLKLKIDEVKQVSGANKVDIVAHSMGGLVARSYLESDSYSNDVNRVVFMGTPHLGSAKSYPTWEAGDVTFESGIVGGLLNYIFTEEAKNRGYLGEEGLYNYIHEKIPTLGQLLPITNYLEKAGARLEYPNGYPRNYYLENLNDKKSLIHERGIEVTNIVGLIPDNTVNYYAVQDVWMGNYWLDGMPLNYYTTGSGVYRDLGDNTVSLSSQLGLLGNVFTMTGTAHIDLPRKAIHEVLTSLNVNYSPIETVAAVNKYLFIAVHSPVDFYIQAPGGKRTGFNKNGAAFDEIEGAFYTGNETETEFLTIPNPLPGKYRVIATGTGTGSYEIEATYADDENSTLVTSSYNGHAVLGKEDMLLVEMDPESGDVETKIEDKSVPITEAILEGSLFNGYYSSDVQVSLSAVDNESGLQKTEYSLDGVLWQVYTGPFMLVQNGETPIGYRSIDWSGNIEVDKTLLVKIDKSKPTVIVNLNKNNFTHWDNLVLSCEAKDLYSGISSFEVRLDGEIIDCTKSVSLFYQGLGAHMISYRAYDNAGNFTSGEEQYKLAANYNSTLQDIFWLFDHGHFKSRGDAVSMAAHIEVAWLFDSLDIGRKSLESLSQVTFLLTRQITKDKISNYGYDMINKDIKCILEGK